MMKKEAARLCGNARMAGRFALQEQGKYGNIKTDEPRTLDFSWVRGFLVTNVCIVQRSAA